MAGNHIDYGIKAKVISLGLVKDYKAISKAKWAEYLLNRDGLLIKTKYDDIEDALKEERFLMSENKELWQEAGKVAHADYYRTARLRNRVTSMLQDGECVFATLTFRDDVLASTSRETRRRYVTRYLKGQSEKYVANIDYGAKNEREHYHAVIYGKINPLEWPYGALNVKKVKDTSKPEKLAKYVNKLTNHAIKETCKRNAVIYSRSV